MSDLDKFGKAFIENVRDEVLERFQMIIKGEMKDTESKKMYEEFKEYNTRQKEFINYVISSMLDESLHNMLVLFEESDSFKINTKSGNNLDELSDGLCGELYSDDGWINKYSKFSSYD